MFAALESLQGKHPCEFNVHPIEKLSSLALNSVITNQSASITNNMEDINNTRKSNNVEEDERNINEHELQEMPLVGVIN